MKKLTNLFTKTERYSIVLTLLLAGGTFLYTGCSKEPEKPDKPIVRLERDDWAPDVKKNINEFLTIYRTSPNAYVVFDFDNTCSIFDVEEQLMAHQLETMSFALDPKGLETAISAGLDDAPSEARDWVSDIGKAYEHLYNSYGPFTPAGLDEAARAEIQKDPYWAEFASKMGAMYGHIADWVSQDASYNWVLYWFTGMTEKEVYDLALRSHQKYEKVETSTVTWKGSPDIKSLLGPVTFEWTSGVAVTDNIRELWRALRENGIDVWVCSASGIQQILAAVDAFGLHDYCTGVIGMTIALDDEGKYVSEYDFDGCGFLVTEDGWNRDSRATGAQTAGPGKVTAICNAIAPRYGGRGPLAGFMDSTGDFNFCTEFASLRMVVCFNRGNRKVTDGGGVIAEVALYQKETLGFTVARANLSYDDTMYLLQGRDENGLRSFRPSNATMRLGKTEEVLLANDDNYTQLEEMKSQKMTTKEAIDRYALGFLNTYNGYHNIK